MTLLDIPMVAIGLVLVAVVVRAVLGPTQADRAVAADLAFFSFLALVALFGARLGADAAFDVVLIGTLTGFVSAVWLARLITRGR
ncbi:monovalent cation/H+ antiporter complex subunit F [Lipingzhangella sp. LS1_29]|uniref:Monovalent cation/H+ antiporter complex subunit F n=1 Tax=Lipingzhangella rawalii TaxID=2055835 RepID=A0ABU2H4Y9_9ACTN|nr:monovalent cation/H+ antiporter complex subunit F [Lipingzhangella rawalii]MDS1269910.1 monovalent cation/H+ antiporter complex subunit F [Lipingzhangella rawalii]